MGAVCSICAKGEQDAPYALQPAMAVKAVSPVPPHAAEPEAEPGRAVATSAIGLEQQLDQIILPGMTLRQFNDHIGSLPPKCLEFVQQHAMRGNVSSVIRAMDAFAYANVPMMNVGDVKGALVDAELAQVQPKVLVELGTYVGYGSLRFARTLQQVVGPSAHIYTFEPVPIFAEIATQIIAYAGMTEMITIIRGAFADSVDQLQAYVVNQVDAVFIDHNKDLYLSDLLVLETKRLLHPGSVVIADNVICPGMPDYLEYVRSSAKYASRLIETEMEYYSYVKDGVEISTFLG